MTHSKARLLDRLPLILFIVSVVVLAIYLAGVATMRYVVERQLHPALPKGTQIGEINMNPLRGSIEVRRFYLRNDQGPRIRVDALIADVNMARLFGGEVEIERLELRDAYLRVDRLPDGTFDLGLPDFGTDGAEDAGPPPDLSLKGLLVDGLRIDYRDGDLRSILRINELTVGEYSLQKAEQEVPVAVDATWDGQQIAGQVVLALGDAGPAITGEVRTDLLDLERAQRLARMTPEVIGRLGFDGDLAWQGDRASASGRLDAPALRYTVAGREIAIDEARAEGFSLDLTLAPALAATLDLGPGVSAAAWSWSADGDRLTSRKVNWLGRIEFRAGSDAVLDGLRLAADSLDWRSGPRSAELSGLLATGRLTQDLKGDAVLPGLDLALQAAAVRYADEAADVAVDVNAPTFERLVLAERQGGAGRPLSAVLNTGRGSVRMGHDSVVTEGLNLDAAGVVSLDTQQLSGDLAVDGIRVEAAALPHGPLAIARVDVNGFAVGEATSAVMLAVRGLSLPGSLPETGLEVATFSVAQASYDATRGVGIGELVIDGLQTGIVRDDSGVWQHVMTAPAPATAETASAPAQPPSTDQAALPWRLGGVKVTGDSHVTLVDRLNPDMQAIRYAVENITIGALDSTRPGADTPFEIALQPDQFSEFRFAGTVRPLEESLFLDAEGHVHGLGLTSVNGLVGNDLGHRFNDGQLDNDFHIRIENNRLEMGNRLSMARLDVEELPDKEGPPLGTAIALLEDRDGNIKLEVPVSGDLSDPDFRVLGVLNPIIMKAVAGTAALAIQPFGSVLLVGTLVADQALKVTFEPALFEPQATTLGSDARGYLEQLAARLKDKPKLAVRVCGVYAASEREKDKKGEFTDKPDDLLLLAQQRADAVTAFMRDQGVGAKQLRRCRPSLDPAEDGAPRVDIRF